MTEVTTEASTESAIPVDALEKLKEKSTDNKDTNKESGD